MSGEGPFPEDASVASDSSVPGDLPEDESDEPSEDDLLEDESDEGANPSLEGAASSVGTGGQPGLNPQTDDEVDRAERHY